MGDGRKIKKKKKMTYKKQGGDKQLQPENWAAPKTRGEKDSPQIFGTLDGERAPQNTDRKEQGARIVESKENSQNGATGLRRVGVTRGGLVKGWRYKVRQKKNTKSPKKRKSPTARKKRKKKDKKHHTNLKNRKKKRKGNNQSGNYWTQLTKLWERKNRVQGRICWQVVAETDEEGNDNRN